MEEGSTMQKGKTVGLIEQASVQYLLTASLIHSRSGKTYRNTRKILIVPSIPMAPPLQMNDFPDEYVLTCKRTLRKRLWNRPIGKMVISAVEPSALNISTRAPKATTVVSVKLLFEPSKAGIPVEPYEWTATVKYHLRSTTFVTTKPFKSAPNYEIVKKSSLLQKFSTTTSSEIRECETLPWRLNRISSQGTILPDAPIKPWTTTLLVPVNVPKSLIPTFLGPILTRRYKIVLQVDLSNLSHGPLNLQIPVQIVNDQPHALGKPQEAMSIQRQDSLPRQAINVIPSTSLENRNTRDSHTDELPPPYEVRRRLLRS